MKINDTAQTPTKSLADILLVSDTQIRNLREKGVFEQTARGKYDLAKCIQAFIAYHVDGQTAGDMTTEKVLLITAQRKKVELDTEEKRGELVSFDQARQTFMAAMTIVATQLDGLAGRVAGELAGISDPAIVRKKLFDETRRIRSAAADKLEDFAGG
ncbi:MAG: hypothetical protein GY942_05450 [Aestuariibacter sp.]|nr:hypothetical protein [Aestuariibacter sp.]